MTVGWRLHVEAIGSSLDSAAKAEKLASKISGCLLFSLAGYVLVDSTRRLLVAGAHARESWIGIVVTTAALMVMPILAKAKLKVAKELNSKALKADAMESGCHYLTWRAKTLPL
jgi:divalent metal cation (Fe/Co/Zn/Cd) transporter